MKKRILAVILCVLMVLPCFVMAIGAVDAEGPDGEEIINVAPNGKTYQSSNWNQDSSARFLNNGVLHHSWQFWRPNSMYRPDSEGVDDSLQYAGMKFNNYYSVNEVTIYAMKYADNNGAFCGKCYKTITDSDYTTTYKEVSGQQVVDQRLCKTCGTNVLDLQMTQRDGKDIENNIKYTVKVLVQGEWIEAGYGYNNDMEYCVDKNYQVIGGDMGMLTIKLDDKFAKYNENGDVIAGETTNYVTTKNIRIECTEYGGAPYNKDPDATTHEWWLVPIMYEIQCWGFKTVNTPKFDVPEGAEVVYDAALGGMAGATTSAMNHYPLLGNDRLATTQWMANDYDNQEYWVDFDKEYQIDKLKFNFGSMPEGYAGSEYTYDVYVKKGDTWELLKADQTVTTVSDLWTEDDLIKFDVNEKISGMKISFKSSTFDGEPIAPRITEVGAEIGTDYSLDPPVREQCVFLSSYLDYYRASSSAQGNLACYGVAYCSSSFDYANISDVNFIIDGQTTDDAFSWYAQDFIKGTYCGVELKDTENVTKVVLYFNDIITQGKPEEHVMSFDIEALVDGKYVKVAEGTSYDPSSKSSVVSIEFDAVRTNDVRIVYKTNGMVFPYLKEMEIYAGEKVYSAYDGYFLDPSLRLLHGRYPTLAFAERSSVARAGYMNLISPVAYIVSVEHMVLAMRYGIPVENII